MGLPDKTITLTPSQIADLNRKLSVMRHNINNHLGLVVAAAELMRRKPEAAERMLDNLLQQPERIAAEMRGFSSEFETVLGMRPPPGTPPPPPSSPH